MSRRQSVVLPVLLAAALALGGCNKQSGDSGREGHDHGPEAEGHAEHEGESHAEHEGEAHAEPEAEAHAEHEGEGHDEHENEGEEGFVELPAGSVVAIKTVPVSRRALDAEREATGQVDYVQSAVAHVAPRIPGRVHRVLADLGQNVRAGQPIVEIDSVELGMAKAAYVQARTREDLAQQSYDREKALRQERISSEQEMLEAEAAWREAESAAEAAAQSLRLYGLEDAVIRDLGPGRAGAIVSVRSPLAGRIVEHHATLGELVTPETHLVTVADISRVWVWIDVPERDIAAVHVGDHVEVSSEAWPGEVVTGEVSFLTPEVDRDARTVRARIEADNKEGRLLPGMFVRVRIRDPHRAAHEGADVLAAPSAAVQRDGSESIVFVAAGERRFERREVRTGRAAGEWVEITDGLAEGESVVVEGGFILKAEASRHALGGGHSH